MTDVRAYLLGEWRLHRRIEDRRAGQTGSFVGRCTFTPTGGPRGELACHEAGQFRLGAVSNPASRDYTYSFGSGSTTAFSVASTDAPLLELDLATGVAEGTHWCAPDTYRYRAEVVGPDAWLQTWTVSGPAKDYTLHSRFSRVLR